jgi:Asp-tRNA(Asn)/Glu-tRNA(Gln) amidotransferase C subunit
MLDPKDLHNLKTRFPEECKRLPLGYLNPEEKMLAEKCINHEEFTEDEVEDLRELLGRYREYFSKYDSVEVEENLDANIKVIETSAELLSLLDDPNRYRFDMHCRIQGQIFRLAFRLKPLADNEYLDLLNVQTRIFRDLNKSEKLVFSKATSGMPLSKEEEKMQQSIQDKIVDKLGDVDKNGDEITTFLINHVELVGDTDLTKKERKKLWQTMDIGSRVLIYNRCKEIIRVDEDLEVELFPDVE